MSQHTTFTSAVNAGAEERPDLNKFAGCTDSIKGPIANMWNNNRHNPHSAYDVKREEGQHQAEYGLYGSSGVSGNFTNYFKTGGAKEEESKVPVTVNRTTTITQETETRNIDTDDAKYSASASSFQKLPLAAGLFAPEANKQDTIKMFNSDDAKDNLVKMFTLRDNAEINLNIDRCLIMLNNIKIEIISNNNLTSSERNEYLLQNDIEKRSIYILFNLQGMEDSTCPVYDYQMLYHYAKPVCKEFTKHNNSYYGTNVSTNSLLEKLCNNAIHKLKGGLEKHGFVKQS